jgi:threonyl-tRNA synthetase
VQCEVVPVQDNVPEVLDHARGVARRMEAAGLRARVSDRPGERMQARIRDAELRKVPHVVVVGRRDVERGDDVVRVRDTRRSGDEATRDLPVAELIAELQAEAARRGREAVPPARA